MKIFDEVLERIEEHKGRKLDLTNHRDLFRLKSAIQREFDKNSIIISNINDVLGGHSTYDESTHKTILDRNRIKS
jgi:hypothetical protein